MPPSRNVSFLVPGSIETRTGGYEYDRRIIGELRGRGWHVDVCATDPSGTLSHIRSGSAVVVDGLGLDAVGAEIHREATRLRIVVLVHMPGASGTDERGVLSAARSIIVTGAGAKRALVESAVDGRRITIVEPGTDAAPVGRGSGSETVHLLCVATVNALKGHEILLRALALIPERHWRLTCAGSLSRDPETAARVRSLVEETHLDDRVTLADEQDEAALAACYDSADVFVLATLSETYGMAVAEAIARGLPVVATATGEIPAIVGSAGVVVAPGDVEGFAAALSTVLRDRGGRERLRGAAISQRGRLRTWEQAGGEMEAVLEKVMANG